MVKTRPDLSLSSDLQFAQGTCSKWFTVGSPLKPHPDNAQRRRLRQIACNGRLLSATTCRLISATPITFTADRGTLNSSVNSAGSFARVALHGT
jgi:hypothetical protein